MARTEGQKISRQKYESKAYDQVLIKVKKGKREEYRQAAESLGLGQMELFRTAVEEYLQKHGVEGYALVQAGEGVIPATSKVEPTEKLTADERRLVQAASKVPNDTRKLFLKLVEDLAAKLEIKGSDSDGKVERAG